MNELISCMKNLPKHFKTAVQNIWRNGVMSFSSIFAVTITLVLIWCNWCFSFKCSRY